MNVSCYVCTVYENDILDSSLGKKDDDSNTGLNSAFLTYGFYIHQASFTYKLMEASSPKPLLIQQKFTFKPVLQLQMEDIAMVTVMQGIHFFDFSLGVRSIKGIHLSSVSQTIQNTGVSQATGSTPNEVVLSLIELT